MILCQTQDETQATADLYSLDLDTPTATTGSPWEKAQDCASATAPNAHMDTMEMNANATVSSEATSTAGLNDPDVS